MKKHLRKAIIAVALIFSINFSQAKTAEPGPVLKVDYWYYMMEIKVTEFFDQLFWYLEFDMLDY